MRALAVGLLLAVTAAAQPAAEKAVVDRWMKTLTPRERIAQLVVIRTHGNTGGARSREWRNIVRWVNQTRVGGIIVVNRVFRGGVVKAQPHETAAFINRLQRMARLPLIVGGDFERGVSMRFDGTVQYPHAMAYGAAGDPALTREFGRLTAKEARALGFQWVFAPTADVNNNPDNPIIGIRAFGTAPALVGEHVRAFIAGAHSFNPRTLVTIKHFPGHGDTDADSHTGVPVINSDRARLDRIELAPFLEGIRAGADSVMTAHIALPNVDESNVPSTISPVVISGLLRKQLGFTGLVTTDAMDMEGLARKYGSAESSVRALEAGVDVLLMPRNPDEAVEAVSKAVASKRLTMAAIDARVRKVLTAKVRLGLHKARLANMDRIDEVIGDEDALAHAQAVAAKAVAVLRGDSSRLPLGKSSSTCVIALAERRGNGQGAQLADDIKALAPGVRTIVLDPAMPSFDGVETGCESIAIGAFLGFGGTGKLNPAYTPLLDHLMASGKKIVLGALGNPFLTRAFPGAGLALTTYSTVPSSESAFARTLFGDLRPTGRAFVSFEK
ncbi:MAG: hypothetical protein FJW30_17925 [Acidobacteria bacterium]|nr:hypothetical protein [Acidobacteriota bacterium]